MSRAPDSTSECAQLIAAWRASVEDSIAAFHAEPARLTDAHEAAGERMNDIAARAWRTPLSDPLALRLRAEIAQHEVWPRLDGGCALNRYEALLSGLEADDDVEVGARGERAIAELVRAVLWAGSGTARPEPPTQQVAPACPDRSETVAQGPAPQRDWLQMLRDAGPNGAAPDERHAAIFGAILDLRAVRDTIENAVECMTTQLDRLADETTLTHAITAGWEPEDDYAAQPEPPHAGTSAGAGDGRAGPPDIDDLVERARDGLMTLRTLWNAHAALPGGVVPEGSVAFAASVEFVVDSLEGVLDDIAEIAATNADDDKAGEAAPPA